MKKALVVAIVMVLGLGLFAWAGPLTGSWSSKIVIDPDGASLVKSFDSVIEIDYTVGGWTFASTAIFNLDAFDNLFFKAVGVLGAFSFQSIVDFEPQTASFMAWVSAAQVSIAGVTFYDIFEVANLGTAASPLIGSGMLIGGSGSAGDVTITAQAQFNMASNNYYMWGYGYDFVLGKMAYQSCGTWYKPSGSYYAVQTNSCTLGWSGFDVYVDFPFTCLTVTAYLEFSCATGFDTVGFWLTDFDLGVPWFSITELDIDFTVNSKTVTLYWGLVLGDALCVTPYLSLEGEDYTVSGITVNALLLEYNWNGVTFKAGEMFDRTWRGGFLSYGTRTYYFTSTGDLTYTAACAISTTYDEYFGFDIDGDSCCGGGFAVSVFTWFDTSASTLFAWEETTADLSLGIGANTTVLFGLSLDNGGLNTLSLGFDFTW